MSNEAASSLNFVKNLIKYFPSKIIPALMGFLTLPLLTQLFDPGDYGNYVLVLTLVNILSLILTSLWGTSIVRFYSNYKKNKKLNYFFDTINVGYVGLIIFISFILTTFLIIIPVEIEETLFNLMIVGLLVFMFSTYFVMLSRVLVAKEKSGIYSLFLSLQSILGFLFGFLFIIYFHIGIIGFLWGNLLSYIILLPLMYWKSLNKVYAGHFFSKKIFSTLTSYGAPLVISNSAAWILSSSDRYLLQFFRGNFEVGIYSASYLLSEYTLIMIWTLFMTAAFPSIVNCWELKGVDETQTHIKKIMRYFILVSVPAAVGLIVLSQQIITVITSSQYYEGYVIVPFVAVGGLFLGLQWWAQLGLLLNKKTKIISILVLISCIVNLVLNFILIPFYGYLGAAVTTLISYFILFLLMIIFSKKYLVLNWPVNSLIKIAISSLIMAISLLIFPNLSNIYLNLLIKIIMGVFVYTLVLFFLREFKKEELKYLKLYIRP